MQYAVPAIIGGLIWYKWESVKAEWKKFKERVNASDENRKKMNQCVNNYDPSDEAFWRQYDELYRKDPGLSHKAYMQGAKAAASTPGNHISGDIPSGKLDVITGTVVDAATNPFVDSAFGGK